MQTLVTNSFIYKILSATVKKSSRVRRLIKTLSKESRIDVEFVENAREHEQLALQMTVQAIAKNPLPTLRDFAFLKALGRDDLIRKKARERDRRIIGVISPNLTVLTGPFKGLRYATLNIKENTLASKIVGSYESELHDVVEKICQTTYRQILDVGCAEGYYAIGLALRMPHTTVYAFDTDEYSRQICSNMSKLNNVQERVVIKEECTCQTLANFDFKEKSLVIADCEGYEWELFGPNCLNNLRCCDILVELHETIRPGVTSRILSLFAPTHYIKVITTKDKPDNPYPELSGLDQEDRFAALCDHRGSINEVLYMEWAWLKSKMT